MTLTPSATSKWIKPCSFCAELRYNRNEIKRPSWRHDKIVSLIKRKQPPTRYIIVTGGVVSGSGKGITAASIGACLKARKIKVSIQKFDMYFNVDAGTLKPGKHGEVYVTTDGAETDLDLGHYERFLDEELSQKSSVMQGALIQEIIDKERAGGFLGDDVQVIPHITNAIQDKMVAAGRNAHVHIIELGGTVGDYEGLAFVEAARQLAYRVGPENILYVHVVYLPYLQVSDEIKTKPAQNSVRDLRSIGIVPNILIARCEQPADHNKLRQKLHLFTSVARENIVVLENVDTVYRVPLVLESQGIPAQIAEWCDGGRKADLKAWRDVVHLATKKYNRTVRIGMIAKYLDNTDTYLSLIEAMRIAAWYAKVDLELNWVNAEELEEMTDSEAVLRLMKFDGILVPGGFGSRGIEGMIRAANYALHNNVPYLGICLGMQVATIAFARQHGLKKANSKEFDPRGRQLVITYMKGQQNLRRKGGTMRLGSYDCRLKPGSIVRDAYDRETIRERHRHRFEFNPVYKERLEAAGLVISGICPQNNLAEIIELPQHAYLVGCQFHPEFSSRPTRPQPLFLSFLKAARQNSV